MKEVKSMPRGWFFRKCFIVAVVAIVMGGGLWGGQRLLYALGEREIALAAHENNYCQDDACEGGRAALVAILVKETGIDADLVPWCMAANAVYTAELGVMDRLREKFADWMYQSCGNDDITLEDAVLSIGEPE